MRKTSDVDSRVTTRVLLGKSQIRSVHVATNYTVNSKRRKKNSNYFDTEFYVIKYTHRHSEAQKRLTGHCVLHGTDAKCMWA